MRIRFVGHASVVLDAGDVVLLTDPWAVGLAFNESWEAYPAPVLDAETLARVTHLWISHEHPDHLSIPTLRALPPARRAAMTLLYQRHWSPEVATFLRQQGFGEVVELDHGELVELGPGVGARLHQVGHEDSALTVHDGRHTVLDLNDCKPAPATLRRILADVGAVDVLLDQFSIAGWPGNPDDGPRMRRSAGEALATFLGHVEAVQPRWVVPFASFVRFCHDENVFMNGPVSRVGDVVAAVGRDRAAVLYPGDDWVPDGPHAGSDAAVARYTADHAAALSLPVRTHPPEPFDDVVAAARSGVTALAGAFHRPLLRRAGPVAFRLRDLDRTIVVDPAGGTADEGVPPKEASVVRLSSQAARYTFEKRWGVPTLLISGRFTVSGPEEPWRRFKQLGSAYAQGLGTRGALRLLADERLRANVRRRWPDLYRDVVRRAA